MDKINNFLFNVIDCHVKIKGKAFLTPKKDKKTSI